MLSAVVLAGCGSKSSQQKSQKVNWMQPAAISTMDGSKMTDLYSSQILNATNDGLLRMGNNKTTPGIAKSYSVSKDGKTWTFNLRKTKWNDGKPVTANDFVFAWRRTVTPKTASEYAYNFGNIKNATKINAGKMSSTKLGVKADGKYKLVVTLNKPQTFFKYLVAQSYYFPQEQSAVKKYGSGYGTSANKMAYNGAFILKGWNGTNESVNLVKNKNYWNAKNVKLNKIHVQAIKDTSTALNQYNSGKLDFTTLNETQVKAYKNNKDFHDYLQASTSYLELNQRKITAFKNKDVRQAISLAINRKQFVSKVVANGSVAPKGLVPAKMSTYKGKDFADDAYVKSGVDYNLTKAKQLWAKGMKAVGKKSLSIAILCDDIPDTVKYAQFVQSQLTKLPGLKVTISNVPFKNRLSRSQNGQFDMVMSAWIADYPDPTNFLDLFKSDSQYNDGKWKNAQFDSLMSKAEGADANNESARWDDMVQAEKVLMNDQGIVPLMQQGTSTLMNSKVKGFQFFQTSPQQDWTGMSVK